MTKYQIYFVRHGRTFFNKLHKMQGWCDSPLLPEGIEVAKSAAKALQDVDFNLAYSTNTGRAVDTANIIMDANKNDLNHHQIPEFREQFYGSFEGRFAYETWLVAGQKHGTPSYLGIVDKYGLDSTFNFLKEADPFDYAENSEEFWSRLDRGFEKLDQVAKDGDKILLVSHSTTIYSLALRYHVPELAVTETPKNSSLTILEREDGVNSVTTYNKVLG
ncbi:histidine phosphatase family protein [Companilactobacillus sp.]|uniref:histidine phosphatase family protein n=1 Tax=Companilactobacillus sp. TaxID=2767905 RepID=UPI0025C58CD9|nr:histidine phosphatase family protein [Companilactobacillus sp.]MCH4009575.1 histidine phosphatase family protein [Companilactobacillus sp.]MCH4052749.1 histidine phosphatase family protein [Companilactobacillus sp.]MCH4077517.1 histidine phosphatase family protein [Companilactobacillus sp.]MCH4126093.1 histidine phosphatase family protein [Companilactobacillus sp.]MCI1311801.1 histidine phosphatase family protein [Companilactobacillus sp.]